MQNYRRCNGSEVQIEMLRCCGGAGVVQRRCRGDAEGRRGAEVQRCRGAGAAVVEVQRYRCAEVQRRCREV